MGRAAGLSALLTGAVLAVGLVVVQPVRVDSASMAPTLRSGDELVVERLSMRWDPPRRGELVTLRDPRSGALLVKRVAAVGGSRVGLADGRLVVDGHRVREPYVDHDSIDGTYYGPVRVPRGHVFVLGDNRGDSTDSRVFGPVRVRDVVGRVVLTLWPPRRPR